MDHNHNKGTNIYGTPYFYPNLALMKISAYYKKKGYKVEWYTPIKKYYNDYHKIFVSKVFTRKTPMDSYLTKDMIIGGTGYDLSTKLPDKIEHIYPDYDLYGIDYAMGFITRGCIRSCDFCIVQNKEGMIHKHADFEEFWNDQKHIRFLDNNFLSYKNHIDELKKIIDINKRIDFYHGLDIRLINNVNASLLRKIQLWSGKRYTFAFDDIKSKLVIEKKLKILNDNGIKNSEINFFVLIGFNSTLKEDLIRINLLRDNKIRVYVMPYNKTIQHQEQYQKDLLKWVNYKPFYWKMDFETFLKKKKRIIKKEKKDTMLNKFLK